MTNSNEIRITRLTDLFEQTLTELTAIGIRTSDEQARFAIARIVFSVPGQVNVITGSGPRITDTGTIVFGT